MNAKGVVIMNISFSGYKANPRRVTVAPGAAIAVEAQPGTELRGVDGTAWITQDGDVQDYIVPAGIYFTADRVGRIVVSALGGAAQVAVSWRAPAAKSAVLPGGVRLDYARIAELKRAAQQARAREIARLFRCGREWLVGAWRNLFADRGERKQAAAVPTRSACHS
jgi:hypothetical protein